MAATAIKVSESLASEARAAAADSDRSLTGQIEHWARIGKALEPLFTAPVVGSLKRCGGDLGAIEDTGERARVLDALAQLRQSPPFAQTAAVLRASGGPLYEADPESAGGIVQVHPDGTRVAGRFVNRVFKPDPPADKAT